MKKIVAVEYITFIEEKYYVKQTSRDTTPRDTARITRKCLVWDPRGLQIVLSNLMND
jgi:hypothetical protein